MNRWTEAGQGWDQMITGHPVSSSYFWMTAITSLGALLGMTKAAVQIAGDRHALMLWGPSLLGALVILCLAAGGATRAVRAARRTPRGGEAAAADELEKRAFEKFRTYFYCAAAVSIGVWIGVALIH